MVLAVIPSIINWTRYVAMVLMVPVFILLFAAYLPGEIKAKVKHPFLVAIKTWVLAHLIANGDLASIILFSARFSLTLCSTAWRCSAGSRRPRRACRDRPAPQRHDRRGRRAYPVCSLPGLAPPRS